MDLIERLEYNNESNILIMYVRNNESRCTAQKHRTKLMAT